MIYQKISTELLTRLDYICLQPQAILVYDNDPSVAIKELKKRYPEARLDVAYQLQNLVDCPERFDFIYAELPSFPKKDPDIIFHFFYHALKVDGLLLFWSLGPDTDAHATACACEKGGVCACEKGGVCACEGSFAFFDMHHIGDWVLAAGFSDPVMDREASTDMEIIYGHGWKVRDMERKSDEYFVSVDNIKKNK